jgi:hypothetical protein
MVDMDQEQRNEDNQESDGWIVSHKHFVFHSLPSRIFPFTIFFCSELHIYVEWELDQAGAIGHQIQSFSLVFVCAVNTKLQGRNFLFSPAIWIIIWWFYELIIGLAIWTVSKNWDFGRQFLRSSFRFSCRPNDWNSCSRYIYIESSVTHSVVCISSPLLPLSSLVLPSQRFNIPGVYRRFGLTFTIGW